MAIGGTPSQSFKLGADLLVQLGDLKGAAKALSEEAKIANKDVREAEREFKKLEKAKASQAELDRARGNIGSASMKAESLSQRAAELRKQDKQRAADKVAIESINRNLEAEKTDRVKEAEKFQKEKTTEFQSGLNTIQKHTQSKILGIKDNIDSVANTLLNPKNGATAQAAGRALSGMSGAITPESISGVIRTVGPAGMVVGGAMAVIYAGDKIAKVGREFYEKQMQATNIQAGISEDVFDRLRSFNGRDIPQEELKRLTNVQGKSREKANELLGNKNLGVDSNSLFGQLFGFNVSQARVESLLVNNALRVPSVAEQFGKAFASRIDIEKMAQTRTANDQFYKAIEARGGWYAAKTKSAIGLGRLVKSVFGDDAGETTRQGMSRLYGVDLSEDIALQWSEGAASRTISAAQKARADELDRIKKDPVGTAERHNRATRFQALEKQRIIRQQSYASF